MKFVLAAIACLPLSALAAAQGLPESFTPGPVIEAFGPNADVSADMAIPDGLDLKVVFDIATATDADKVSRDFESVARFINMHARAGLDMSRIRPAIVVHGGAATSLLTATEDRPNATAPLIEALIEADVPIYLCGQTAAARSINKDDLIPGVDLALSAMTAHAVLAADGYSLNPF